MTHLWWVFAAMVGVMLLFLVWRRTPIGVALLFGAVAGGLVSGNGIPVRHLVEGAFTYFDPILLIFAAMFLMRVLEENGSLAELADLIVSRLGGRPALLLAAVTLFVMLPAMLTGVSTTSVLTTGAVIAGPLMSLGLPRALTASLIALASVMGMIAPPVNLIAMLVGQGVDMPYIGFFWPLALITFPVALVGAYAIAYPYLRKSTPPLTTVAESVPDWRRQLPLISVLLVTLAIRALPGVVPDLGMPLIFILGGLAGLAVGRRVNPVGAAYRALKAGLPVLALLVGIGAFLQIMTLTGVRGMLVVTVLALPPTLTFLGMLVSLPLFGGVSAFASGMVFGIPFVLALLGHNEVLVCAGVSLLAGLGDVLPPSAVAARFAAQVAGETNFLAVVRRSLPWVAAAAAVALIVIYAADHLSFLTG